MTDSTPALPSNRKFGGFFTLVFAVLAWYLGRRWGLGWGVAAGGISVALALVSVAAPAWLTGLNRAWFRLGLLMGRVVSPIVLGLIFFGLITPVAVLMRLFGRDALRLKRSATDSHWIARDPPGPDPQSYRNPF